MWQQCFGKIIIIYKCVDVYILLLMWNSSFLYYLGNTIEIKIKIKIKYALFLQLCFCNEMDPNFLHMYEYNLIQFNCITKIKLQKTRIKNCHLKPN
jgi:hypothetical protein